MSELELGLALIATVLTISALASPLVERAPLSFPMIFLGLGLLLGENGLGFVAVDPHGPFLEAVATFTLSLVLFLDAVNVQFDELRSDWRAPMLSLGPGTLLTIALVAGAAMLLFDAPPVYALLTGAILSSTDPVVLRDIERDERIPRSVRRALSVEAGMNDIVVLPIVLVLIAVVQAETSGAVGWLVFLGRLLLLSPLVGLVVGGVGAMLMQKADARLGIRREYQALYGVGLVLAAYAAGQMVQGDGFLAAFFAGLAVPLFNVVLCDCFLEYGEVTAEMSMFLAFVLFGATLSTLFGAVPLLPALALASLVILVDRPLALGLVLRRARISNMARAFIAWFGPRGLNSLLLALLVVHAGLPGAERLLGVVGVVVLVSVVAHGITATPLSTLYARRVAADTLAEEREATATGLFQRDAHDAPRISPEDLVARLEGTHPPIVLDVRSRSQYDRDATQIPGSVRVPPDQIEAWAAGQPRGRSVVAYCT